HLPETFDTKFPKIKKPQDYVKYFAKILKNISFTDPLPEGFLLNFLGDLMSDRGQNDLFTLMFFEKLHTANIPFEIAFSNHDQIIIEMFFANQFSHNNTNDLEAKIKLVKGQQMSLDRLITLSNKDPDLKSYVENLINTAYVPHINLICYSVNEDLHNISIRTHAPFDLADITELASFMQNKLNTIPKNNLTDEERKILNYQPIKELILANVNNFTTIVDSINSFFRNPKNRESISLMFTEMRSNNNSPIYKLIWNRQEPKYAVQNIGKHAVSFTNGHTKSNYSLDNSRGKLNNEMRDIEKYIHLHIKNIIQNKNKALYENRNKDEYSNQYAKLYNDIHDQIHLKNNNGESAYDKFFNIMYDNIFKNYNTSSTSFIELPSSKSSYQAI
ncbi:MAG: hypothetical protein KC414_12295, partial [Romboutsia sp.]|nr:hypothetical protein [Romboutsia sp.]